MCSGFLSCIGGIVQFIWSTTCNFKLTILTSEELWSHHACSLLNLLYWFDNCNKLCLLVNGEGGSLQLLWWFVETVFPLRASVSNLFRLWAEMTQSDQTWASRHKDPATVTDFPSSGTRKACMAFSYGSIGKVPATAVFSPWQESPPKAPATKCCANLMSAGQIKWLFGSNPACRL